MPKLIVEDDQFFRYRAIAELQMSARVEWHDPSAIVLASPQDVRNSYHPEIALSRWSEDGKELKVGNKGRVICLLYSDPGIKRRTEFLALMQLAGMKNYAVKPIPADLYSAQRTLSHVSEDLNIAAPFFNAARLASRDITIASGSGEECTVRMCSTTGMVCYFLGTRAGVLKRMEIGESGDAVDADMQTHALLRTSAIELLGSYGEVARDLPHALHEGGIDMNRIKRWSEREDRLAADDRTNFTNAEDALETILAACLQVRKGRTDGDLVALANVIIGGGS